MKTKVKLPNRSHAEIDKLVNDNMPLVHFMRKKYSQTLDESEGFSLGMEGLLMAAQRYEPERGRFGVYAAMCIKQRFYAYIRSEKRICRNYGIKPLPLDFKLSDEFEIQDLIADENALMPFDRGINGERDRMLSKLLSTCDSRERDVMERRFGLNDREMETLEEIAPSYKVSRERIRQIEASVLKRFRQELESAERKERNRREKLTEQRNN